MTEPATEAPKRAPEAVAATPTAEIPSVTVSGSDTKAAAKSEPGTSKTAASQTAAAAQTEAPAPSRAPGASFGAAVAGGVVAAVIGAGVAVIALPYLPTQLQNAILPPQTDLASAQDLAQQKARIDALSADVGKLRSAPLPAATDASGVQAALDQNTATVRDVQDALKALQTRVETLGAAQGAAPGTTPTELQNEIDALKAQVAALSPQAIDAQIQSATQSAEAQLKQNAAQAESLHKEAEAAVRHTIAQAAVSRLAAAFDAGLPLGPALADAAQAGVKLPPALTPGVPSLATLQYGFPAAARSALTASRKAEAGDNIGARIGAFLMAQMGARSIAPHDGSDPDAVLSRAQAAVDEGNLNAALQEISALPAPGQQALASWSAAAQSRLAAGQAIADLAQPAK